MARSGSRRTNSRCLSTMSDFVAITMPAPCERPDSSTLASFRRSSTRPERPPPETVRAIWSRSASFTAPTSSMASTKNRNPSWVGARPAEVWGAAISPSSSRSAMTLRTEAGESCMSSILEMARDPTGSPVSRYRSTSRRKISWLRAESASRNSEDCNEWRSMLTPAERSKRSIPGFARPILTK